jgi:hypothetical protein
MKQLNVVVILIAACLAFLFLANTQREGFIGENHMKSSESETVQLTLNLSSDKEVYHSSEEMELGTAIETGTGIENLTIRVYGIKDSRGNYRVNGERVVNVDPPGAAETFAFRMPSCYGCAGVSPGEYEIVFEVLQNGEVIENCSKTVKLEK